MYDVKHAKVLQKAEIFQNLFRLVSKQIYAFLKIFRSFLILRTTKDLHFFHPLLLENIDYTLLLYNICLVY